MCRNAQARAAYAARNTNVERHEIKDYDRVRRIKLYMLRALARLPLFG